jgi:hypothetical protein
MKTMAWNRLMLSMLAAATAFGGCAHAPPAATGAPSALPAETADGYQLAMTTFECWLGPVWDDALGAPPEARAELAKEDCNQVAAAVWGDTERTHIERLRAQEQVAVEDAALKVRALAGKMSDGDRRALVQLFKAVAAAQHENMWARRGADRIKIDLADDERPRERLTADEHAVIAALDAKDALAVLWHIEGPFAADARTLALMVAMDRMQAARGLPKHMKVYAVRGAFELFFNLGAPAMAADPMTPLEPGAWLDYLTRAAAAAGHAAVGGTTPRERNQLAWGSVLEGFADRLRPELPRVSARLRPVVRGVVARLDAEYVADRNATAKR